MVSDVSFFYGTSSFVVFLCVSECLNVCLYCDGRTAYENIFVEGFGKQMTNS